MMALVVHAAGGVSYFTILYQTLRPVTQQRSGVLVERFDLSVLVGTW